MDQDGAHRDTILAFLAEIGIAVRETELTDPFLPGIDIQGGAIVVDWKRCAHIGDLLHEAGHLAVASPEERNTPKLEPTPADEMTAIAWSYAASLHLGIPIEVLFHPDGYKGGSQALIDAFSNGHYFGVPLMATYGMTVEPRRAVERGLPPYPHMLRWVR